MSGERGFSRELGVTALTYYIISIVVLDQSERIALLRAGAVRFLDHLEHYFSPLLGRPEHQTFLNDVAGKLVLREVEQICLD